MTRTEKEMVYWRLCAIAQDAGLSVERSKLYAKYVMYVDAGCYLNDTEMNILAELVSQVDGVMIGGDAVIHTSFCAYGNA